MKSFIYMLTSFERFKTSKTSSSNLIFLAFILSLSCFTASTSSFTFIISDLDILRISGSSAAISAKRSSISLVFSRDRSTTYTTFSHSFPVCDSFVSLNLFKVFYNSFSLNSCIYSLSYNFFIIYECISSIFVTRPLSLSNNDSNFYTNK